MSEAIVMYGDFTHEQVQIIKDQICRGSTDGELRLFLATCERLQLDPFARQIFGVKRWDKDLGREVMAVQVSIDGFRSVADASGVYEGQTAPQWCGDDGVWREVWLDKAFPAAARVGVWRIGFREPVYGVATWDSYVQTKKDGGPTRMWSTMPDVMLAKCAEALALRKAFPRKLSGVYTPDEMGQSDNDRPAVRIGGSDVHIGEIIAPDHSYEEPKHAHERDQSKAYADTWTAEKVALLREAAAELVEDLQRDDAMHPDDRVPVIAGAKSKLRLWCEQHAAEAATVYAHPGTSGAKRKLWNALLEYAKACDVSDTDMRAWLAGREVAA